MQLEAGTRFRVYNGDAKGTIVQANTQNVSYNFDHDLEVTHTVDRKHFESFTHSHGEK